MNKPLQLALAALLTLTTLGTARAQTTTILNRDAASAVLPATVFFRGQTASVQLRNSAGLRVGADKSGTDARLVLAAVVDTSGYSSAVQQKYQAYLITEVPLYFPAERGSIALPPGAYGFGFLPNNRMVIMDIGGNDILTTATTHDPSLTRPNPLQVLAAPDGTYRLYMGRTFVSISLAGYK